MLNKMEKLKLINLYSFIYNTNLFFNVIVIQLNINSYEYAVLTTYNSNGGVCVTDTAENIMVKY